MVPRRCTHVCCAWCFVELLFGVFVFCSCYYTSLISTAKLQNYLATKQIVITSSFRVVFAIMTMMIMMVVMMMMITMIMIIVVVPFQFIMSSIIRTKRIFAIKIDSSLLSARIRVEKQETTVNSDQPSRRATSVC